MRIHRIRIRNYRGVSDREIQFEPAGVTIVEGDNEIGKSSIAEAIDLLFAEYDDATKARVKAVKPVDRDVGAEIEAEVTTGDFRFVYSKRWHRDRFTKLDVIGPRRQQLTGRAAHDRVKEILDETVDDALWRALRVDQDEATAQPVWGTDSSLTRALDLVAGGSAGSAREGDLYSRVCDEREKYWTPTGRANADHTSAEKRATETEEHVREVEALLQTIEADVARHERLTRELAGLRDCQVELEKERDGLGAEWGDVELRKADVERLASAAEVSAGTLALAREAAGARADLISEVDRRREVHREIDSEHRRGGPALEAAGHNVEVAEGRLAELRKTRDDAAAGADRAAADHRYLRDLLDLEMLAERHANASEAEEQVREIDDMPAAGRIDEEVLQAIEAAHARVLALRGSLDVSAGVVRTEAIHDVTLQVGDEVVELRRGESDERQITGEMELLIGDQALIVVVPGNDARALRADLDAALADVDRLCRSAGVEDLAAARRANEERVNAEQRRGAAVQRRNENLRDLTLDEISGKSERRRAAIAEHAGARGADPPLPPDRYAAERHADDARAVVLAAETDVLACAERLESARSRHQEILINRSGLTERLRASLTELSDTRARLEVARGEESDESLSARVSAAACCAESEDQARREAAQALEGDDPESLTLRFENAKRAVERAVADIRNRENELSGVEGRLEVQGEGGLQLQLDDAITLLTHARDARDRLEARAAAALMLHDSMTRHRNAARRRYVAPFRERIESLARIVFGPSLEIDLDEDLRIVRRTLGGVTLDWKDLSVGAKEQLAVIARLACAAIVSGDGGVPVIFDDALGNTDSGRLERMGAVLSSACGGSQVIVLTCMPDRYRHVGAAKVVRITA